MEGKDVVLKMNKSIYGQVDSPKLFYEHLSKGMDKLGFVPSDSDPCLFIHSELPIMVLNYCVMTKFGSVLTTTSSKTTFKS